jgi:hypothetical protein
MTYRLELIDIQCKEPRKLSAGYAYWHNPQFMAALADMHGVKAMQLQVYKGEELVAILPLYERKKMGIKALVAPSGTYYQGICFAFEPACNPSRVVIDTTTITGEIAEYLASAYPRIHLRLNPENTDVRGFTWHGFKAIPLYTFRWFLNSELHTLADERKKLRQAEAEGMSLQEAFVPDAFLQLQKELEQRKQHSLGISHARLRKFFSTLYEQKLLKQFNIHHNSEIVSSNILLTDGGEIAYTINLATAPAAMKRGAATYHSLALARFLPEQTRILDYCGANVKEVARFKSALGLELQSFFQISR